MNKDVKYYTIVPVMRKHSNCVVLYICIQPIGMNSFFVLSREIFRERDEKDRFLYALKNIYELIDYLEEESVVWCKTLEDAINLHNTDFELP